MKSFDRALDTIKSILLLLPKSPDWQVVERTSCLFGDFVILLTMSFEIMILLEILKNLSGSRSDIMLGDIILKGYPYCKDEERCHCQLIVWCT